MHPRNEKFFTLLSKAGSSVVESGLQQREFDNLPAPGSHRPEDRR
jgi:hypothetical protein